MRKSSDSRRATVSARHMTKHLAIAHASPLTATVYQLRYVLEFIELNINACVIPTVLLEVSSYVWQVYYLDTTLTWLDLQGMVCRTDTEEVENWCADWQTTSGPIIPSKIIRSIFLSNDFSSLFRNSQNLSLLLG